MLRTTQFTAGATQPTPVRVQSPFMQRHVDVGGDPLERQDVDLAGNGHHNMSGQGQGQEQGQRQPYKIGRRDDGIKSYAQAAAAAGASAGAITAAEAAVQAAAQLQAGTAGHAAPTSTTDSSFSSPAAPPPSAGPALLRLPTLTSTSCGPHLSAAPHHLTPHEPSPATLTAVSPTAVSPHTEQSSVDSPSAATLALPAGVQGSSASPMARGGLESSLARSRRTSQDSNRSSTASGWSGLVAMAGAGVGAARGAVATAMSPLVLRRAAFSAQPQTWGFWRQRTGSATLGTNVVVTGATGLQQHLQQGNRASSLRTPGQDPVPQGFLPFSTAAGVAISRPGPALGQPPPAWPDPSVAVAGMSANHQTASAYSPVSQGQGEETGRELVGIIAR